MNKFILIFGLFFLGGVFDVMSAPFPGFYFLPAFLTAVIFFTMPFIFDFLNFVLAAALSLAAMLLWGWFYGFEYGGAYFFHILIYFVLLLIIFYLSYVPKTKQRN